MKKKSKVILLATHQINYFIISQYYSIQKGIDYDTDLFLLLESDERSKPLIPSNIMYYLFSKETLKSLRYTPILETIIPGSNHFPVFQFFKDHPYYTYYWNIEYDVYFHGNWDVFFKKFESTNADFISSHVEAYNSRPDWGWWSSLSLKTVSIEMTNWIKSFNPIYRISNTALRSLDALLRAGNSGHHEVLIATLLSNAGFLLMDFGGCGVFTPESIKNMFYQSYSGIDDFYSYSTMRYRPVFRPEYLQKIVEDNRLYHPVKSAFENTGSDGYGNNRKDFSYIKKIIKLLNNASISDCKSIIDVGSRGVDVISDLPLDVKVSLDLEKPLVVDGVKSITCNFFDFEPTELFDIVCCFQTLEHVPDVEAFTDKLFNITKKYVFISVPYKWPAGLCVEHVHDPIDEQKLASWTKRQPIIKEIITESNFSRLICIYRIKPLSFYKK